METVVAKITVDGEELEIILEIEQRNENPDIWYCYIDYGMMRWAVLAPTREEALERGRLAWLAIDDHYDDISDMIDFATGV